MALGDLSLLGKGPSIQQVPKYSPQQMNALNNLLGSSMSQLQNLQGANGFAPIAQKARTDFLTKTIPSIAERFTAMGGSNKGSGAFQGALGEAGSTLEESLAALGARYNLAEQQ